MSSDDQIIDHSKNWLLNVTFSPEWVGDAHDSRTYNHQHMYSWHLHMRQYFKRRSEREFGDKDEKESRPYDGYDEQ